MAVFVSYSSRDDAAVQTLLNALRLAREQVWLDEDLEVGESWWRTILEQIRGCDVFLVAVSDNSAESKPCQAELKYAQDLGKPVLPVQIGPVDAVRTHPLAAIQWIDFRKPTVDTGVELVATMHAQQAKRVPLPDPLPVEPAMPFEYLMRLASMLDGPMSLQDQSALLSALRTGLVEDGHDIAARRDITNLLHQLRDHPDVMWRIRTEVEAVLASLDTMPLPLVRLDGPPPPRPPRRARATRVAIAGVVVLAAVAGGISFAFRDGSPPPADPIVTPESLSLKLLTTGEIDTIMGTTDLEASEVAYGMTDYSYPTSNPVCGWLTGTAMNPIYEGSGNIGVVDQTFQKYEDQKLVWANQTVVAFPTADKARTFVDRSADKWESCVGQAVTVQLPGLEQRITFEPLERSDVEISQVSQDDLGDKCLHVLRAVSNVVIEVNTCSDGITNESTRIADQIARRIEGSAAPV